MRDTLLLSGIVGFSLGVLGGSLFDLSWYCAALLALIAGTVLSFFFLKRSRVYAAVFVCILFVAVGIFRVLLAPTAPPESFLTLFDTAAVLEGVVITSPDTRETANRITIEVREGAAKTRILVAAPLYPEVHFGEVVRVSGTLQKPEPFDTDGGRVFRYDRFLAKDGVFAVMNGPQIEVLAPRAGFPLLVRGALSDFKTAFLRALQVALPEPHASLAGGLVAGGKQGLGKELIHDFTEAGLVHIVVLSGYNVMIVAQFVLILFAFWGRRTASILAGVVIALFVLVAGAGAASIRAGLMASIALFGRATGKTGSAFRALLTAFVLMLVWNPLLLAYDPGFQLSFIATLGLLFGAPLVEKRLMYIRSSYLREIASTTIAAQIAVLPLLLYQTGLLSFIAFPANLIALPVVPLAMAFSALAGLFGLLLPAFAPIAGLPAYFFLSYLIGVVEVLSELPFASLGVPVFPFWLVAIVYGCLGFFVVRYGKTQKPLL